MAQGSGQTTKEGNTIQVNSDFISTIVEFRPLTTYKGEFGFDWLRVKETLATELPYINSPNQQDGVLLYAYKDGKTNYNATEAMELMKKNEFEQFLIDRKNTTGRQPVYYIPYLYIYPNDCEEAQEVSTLYGFPTQKAPSSVDLRMIIDNKGQSPDKVDLVFDTSFFKIKIEDKEISSPYTLPEINYRLTGYDDNTSMQVVDTTAKELVLSITCIKEFSENKYIEVYAYSKNMIIENTTPQKNAGVSYLEAHREPPQLAGKLCILKNSKENRKSLNLVFVKVKTDILQNTKSKLKGTLGLDSVTKFFNALHQALIHPKVVYQMQKKEEITLDLTKNPDFIATKSKGNGKFIKPAFYNELDPTTHKITGKKELSQLAGGYDMDTAVLTLFNQEYPQYKDYFAVFMYGEKNRVLDQSGYIQPYIIGGNVRGNIVTNPVTKEQESVFYRSVSLYASGDTATLGHEALHGLKLRHTHLDWPVLKPAEAKYGFENGLKGDVTKATYNIMSYNPTKIYTWQWQWLIMRANV